VSILRKTKEYKYRPSVLRVTKSKSNIKNIQPKTNNDTQKQKNLDKAAMGPYLLPSSPTANPAHPTNEKRQKN